MRLALNHLALHLNVKLKRAMISQLIHHSKWDVDYGYLKSVGMLGFESIISELVRSKISTYGLIGKYIGLKCILNLTDKRRKPVYLLRRSTTQGPHITWADCLDQYL